MEPVRFVVAKRGSRKTELQAQPKPLRLVKCRRGCICTLLTGEETSEKAQILLISHPLPARWVAPANRWEAMKISQNIPGS